MNDETPFIRRKYLGLRPGQWLIVIGLSLMIAANLVAMFMK